MSLDTEGGSKDLLPEKTRQALAFVSCIARQLSPEKKAAFLSGGQWKKDVAAGLLAFMLGAKPAVLMTLEIDDPDIVQQFFDEHQIDAFVYRKFNLIVHRDTIMQRINDEHAFATELGWKESMSLEDWLAQADPLGNEKQRAIIGFFLGYPQSAIRAYFSHAITSPYQVDIEGPYGGRPFYFATDVQLAHAEDVEELVDKTRRTFEDAGLGKFLN